MQHNKLNHLANAGDPRDGDFVVAVALHSRLTEEQVDLVVVPLGASLTLWHLCHGDKGGLWPVGRRNSIVKPETENIRCFN